MKKIENLVPDIYNTLEDGTVVSDQDIEDFGRVVADIVSEEIKPEKREFQLRMSNLGQCTRKLWYEKNMPEKLEKLDPHVRLKFLIGHLWEAVLLFLTKASGHSVEGQQDEIDLHGVKGHRDAVVDGMIIDVKSASTFSFQKFEDGLTEEKDSFGYLTQIGGYLEAAENDPLVTDKHRTAFLAGDKTLGHIHLDVHPRGKVDYKKLIDRKLEALNSADLPPRDYEDEPFQKSGNRKLGTVCSYCPAKSLCWPGLRRFNYSGRPVWLTKVVKEPRVGEEKGPF